MSSFSLTNCKSVIRANVLQKELVTSECQFDLCSSLWEVWGNLGTWSTGVPRGKGRKGLERPHERWLVKLTAMKENTKHKQPPLRPEKAAHEGSLHPLTPPRPQVPSIKGQTTLLTMCPCPPPHHTRSQVAEQPPSSLAIVPCLTIGQTHKTKLSPGTEEEPAEAVACRGVRASRSRKMQWAGHVCLGQIFSSAAYQR